MAAKVRKQWLWLLFDLRLLCSKTLEWVLRRSKLAVTFLMYCIVFFYLHFHLYIFFIRIKAGQRRFTCVALHHEQLIMATGDISGRVLVWNDFMRQPNPVFTSYHWHQLPVNSVCFSEEGKQSQFKLMHSGWASAGWVCIGAVGPTYSTVLRRVQYLNDVGRRGGWGPGPLHTQILGRCFSKYGEMSF